MKNTGLTRGFALLVGGLAIAGMGLTAGCSAKQSPAPTEQMDSQVESKRPSQKEPGEKAPKAPNSYKPSVKAPSAPTATPGDN